ncbi:cytosine-specific methyltransferase [Novosphingobium indicum]|uniref:Cytosine-specific methyltransferase n=1 Tax=Novosphingobium indicum TaxID=462949 RepID=A0ABQ2JMM4_9SPHN|nr:DNA (cytosine-5-)-methyltransferase [Novosphingobium indicum]GGN51444.1 cytosine-specific methyltransferase [Novosphingobium indicum]
MRIVGNRNDFQHLCDQAGLTLEQAADVLKVSERTAYRYANGTSRPSALALSVLRDEANKGNRSEPVSSFRFIDLFAGIGGLRLGFESIGGHCVFTSEWDDNARKTYALNFRDNHPLGGDIREFSSDPDKIPEFDVLLAGFPCQPFSIAGVSKKNALGRPHGFLCDTQGTLFFDAAQIIAHHRPAAFVLENVKNLESHDKGRTFATIMNVLKNELGYKRVQARVISSEPWVPQKRERIFIVGFRDDTDFDLDKVELPAKSSGPKLGSILEPHEAVDPKYTLTPRLWEYLQAYRAKHEAKGNGFGYSLFGPDDVTRTLSARYYKDGSEVLIDQPGKRPRRLTPLECARLMGFDRGERRWRIEVSDTQAYRQFGNAVVVPVVEFIAKAMEPYLRKALEGNSPSRSPGDIPVISPPPREQMVANG